MYNLLSPGSRNETLANRTKGKTMDIQTHSRRKFLAFAAASPLAGISPLLAQRVEDFLVMSPKEVLAVKDMEILAGQKIAPPHWGYLQTGVDDDLTLKANAAAYKKIAIRPRRLQGAGTSADTGFTIFGDTWSSPIHLCPVATHKYFHKEGENGTARAAKAKKTLMVLSTETSVSVEDVAKELGRPPWYQMYAPGEWTDVEKMTRRVEAAGCSVLVLTVDNVGGRNRETEARIARKDGRACAACHGADWKAPALPMLAGRGGPTLDWPFVERLRKLTKMKLVLKGIVRRDDAALAVEHGVDGIVVSNHGGRVADENRGSIEALPEVLEGVNGRMPVFVDGGVRRGTDVFKALALGAKSVGIGRPYIWGLGAFGQAGVERVIDILNGELAMVMRQCGTKSISEINQSFLA